jgi:hypothetical protein
MQKNSGGSFVIKCKYLYIFHSLPCLNALLEMIYGFFVVPKKNIIDC